MAGQCCAGVLSSLAGNFLCARACVSFFIPWRAFDFECVDRRLHACDNRSKSSRTRYHLWLFRSRQPTLELPSSPRYQPRNSCGAAHAFLRAFAQARNSSAITLIHIRKRLRFNALVLPRFLSNSDACTGPHWSEPDFVGLIKSSSLSLYCPSREDSGSVGSSIRALDHSFCDCGTRESDSRRIATRAANAIAADYDYRTITDRCTGESVASSDSRPNSIVRIRKSRSQGPAFRNLGDRV